MRFLVAAAIVLAAGPPADACIPVFTRAIIGAPLIDGAATVTDKGVDVACDANQMCTVVATFDVAVQSPARVNVEGYILQELALVTASGRVVAPPADGEKAVAVLELATTDRQLEVRARIALREYRDDCLTSGVLVRHPLLSASPRGDERIIQIDTTLEPRVKAPDSWDLLVDTYPAAYGKPASKRLWFTVPGRLVTHGGPVVLFGATSGDGHLLHVRAAWEAAIGKPWLVFALAGDTDFRDVWNVALTAEPTSAASMLPVTFGLGGGAVIANDSRFGGRGQLSIALGPLRVQLSVDAMTDGDWSSAALIGGGL